MPVLSGEFRNDVCGHFRVIDNLLTMCVIILVGDKNFELFV